MRKKFLLGVMNDKIIIGEFEVRDWNGYNEFSASFDVGEAFNIDLSEDEIKDYWNEYFNCISDSEKLDILQDGERTKQDWLDEMVSNSYYSDIKDCSCTDLELEYSGSTINFETISCGQHDCRKDEEFKDMVFTNKEAFDKLMNLWDKYHLSKIDQDGLKEIEEIENLLEPFDWYGLRGDEVDNFIVKNLKY